MNRYVLNFDGGGASTGGPGGWGAVLAWPDGGIVEERHGWLEDATNNEAEYSALIYGLRLAREYSPAGLRIIGDSQLVVKQVTPSWWATEELTVERRIIYTARPLPDPMPSLAKMYVNRCKGANLRSLHAIARQELLWLSCEYTMEWTKRTGNTRADSLATLAQKEKGPLTPLPL